MIVYPGEVVDASRSVVKETMRVLWIEGETKRRGCIDQVKGRQRKMSGWRGRRLAGRAG